MLTNGKGMHNQVLLGLTPLIFLVQVLPLRFGTQEFLFHNSEGGIRKRVFILRFKICFHYISEQNHCIFKTSRKEREWRPSNKQASASVIPLWRGKPGSQLPSIARQERGGSLDSPTRRRGIARFSPCPPILLQLTLLLLPPSPWNFSTPHK